MNSGRQERKNENKCVSSPRRFPAGDDLSVKRLTPPVDPR